MRSDITKTGLDRTPARALIFATGVPREEMGKPFIGICSSFTDLIPGHTHLRRLERAVEHGVCAGGGVPFVFSVPGVCDGIVMGHGGMHYSLPSRELIADMIESVVHGPHARRPRAHRHVRQDRARHAHGRGAPRHTDAWSSPAGR